MNIIKYIANNITWFALAGLAAALAVLTLLLRSKNRQLKDLETGIEVKSAKLQLENVLIKNRLTIGDLQDLGEIKDVVKKELYRLEKQLEMKLLGKMTAEEIVEKLKEVGFPQ